MKIHPAKNLVTYAIAFLIYISITGFSLEHISRFSGNVSVKLEQEKDAINVSVKASADNNVQFFMFNIEGKLIKGMHFTGTKKFSITPLPKGIYLYELFNDDERIKSGKIELK